MFDVEGYKEMITTVLHNGDVLAKLLGKAQMLSV